ncbi:tyrosine-type recombinase/integrase [Agrobacterium vitis]|nr:tyrosine-type recombinase/integrase [Agrobacterium vitis]
MGLTLKYVKVTKAGTFHYRRRVPKDMATSTGQIEFKRFLGKSEREALRNYPKTHAFHERLIEEFRNLARDRANLTALEAHELAERKAADLTNEWVASIGGRRLTGADEEAVDLLLDGFEASGSTDVVERQALSILASGGKLSRPTPTVEDAKRLYFKEKIKGTTNEGRRTLRLDRAMELLSHSVDAGRPLDRLTRKEAREVRDYMHRDLRMAPNTVKRYIADIRSMINLGLRENDMRAAVNPFNGLAIKIEEAAQDERMPFPEDMVNALNDRIAGHAGADLSRIWSIIEGTGCRLSEVTGLMVDDVKLGGPIPYLNLIFHPHRRLKNRGSIRRVPLIGKALSAAREAVKAAGGNPYLFVQYAGVITTKGGKGKGKQDATFASNALMKHVREVTKEPKLVVHSLRHTMEDRMLRARVDEFVRNLVLGHSDGAMNERYGGPDARLEVAEQAVKAALKA